MLDSKYHWSLFCRYQHKGISMILVEKEILKQEESGGRSTNYELNEFSKLR